MDRVIFLKKFVNAGADREILKKTFFVNCSGFPIRWLQRIGLIMKLLPFLTAIAASSLSIQAATINLDLTSNNAGNITLDAGSNNFSFTGFTVDYLIVGGGGGGGSTRNSTTRAGGGGGAGGLIEGTTSISGVQSIMVGAGGAGGVPRDTNSGGNGQNSSAFSFTAIGGGGGGTNVSGSTDGNAGGSGGGAASNGTTGGSATSGQGNAGAAGGMTGGRTGWQRGGGGGGAGGAGVEGNSGGTGGAGLSRSITGYSVTYAQGGDGGSTLAQVSVTPDAAPANTGNGGLGVSLTSQNVANGGDGGSGIVVVRYTGSQVLTGGIVSTVGGATVHQFTDTGTSTMGFNATIAGNIDGAGALDWNGGGTLTLSGTNTYAGGTTVSAGALHVTGSITGNLTVGNATLGGGGAVGNISFGDGSFFDMFTAVADSDSLAANAISFAAAGFGIDNLLYDGSAVNWGTISSNTYTLITGTLDSTNLGNIGWENAYIIGDGRHAYFTDGSLQLVVETIPEPSAALLGGVGMLLLLRRRRK